MDDTRESRKPGRSPDADDAADAAFLADLRNRALDSGEGHVDPARIVAMSETPQAPPTDAERAHLERCADCREDLEQTRALPALDALDVDEKRKVDIGGRVSATSSWRQWLRSGWFLGTGGFAVAAVLGTILILGRADDPVALRPEVVALAQVRPIPLRVPRGEVPQDPFTAALLTGLEAYVAGDFTAAAAKLEEATTLQPDNSEAWVFRGSAELLAQQTDQAVRSLQNSVDRSAAPDHLHESRWQLANAFLTQSDIAKARPLLDILASEDGPRSESARTILQGLAALP